MRSFSAAGIESPGIHNRAYRNTQILLVDDSLSDVELTVHVLKHAGLATSIAVAEDGAEALDYLFCRGVHQGRSQSDRPCVVLLDLNLPKVDGLDVLKALRADDRTRAIPVVILTSSKETKDLIAAYQLGTSAFIQKPGGFRRISEYDSGDRRFLAAPERAAAPGSLPRLTRGNFDRAQGGYDCAWAGR